MMMMGMRLLVMVIIVRILMSLGNYVFGDGRMTMLTSDLALLEHDITLLACSGCSLSLGS